MMFKKKAKVMPKSISIIDSGTPFYIVEAFKQLRTNIMFALATEEKKSFVVSSADANEGKSMISFNLALAFAEAAQKVLYIDGDLRKPELHKNLELENKTGLSRLLAGFEKKETVIQTISEHLDVITGGPVPPNPSELLASDIMANFIMEVEKEYDYVIIDSPPALVTDAVVMARNTAGLILVVREKMTDHRDLDHILNNMEFVGVKPLGFVLNCAEKQTGSYNRHGYYGKYGHKIKKYGFEKYNIGYSYGYGYGAGLGVNGKKGDS